MPVDQGCLFEDAECHAGIRFVVGGVGCWTQRGLIDDDPRPFRMAHELPVDAPKCVEVDLVPPSDVHQLLAVAWGYEQDATCRLTVPSGTSGFLGIRLERSGRHEVDDEAHIRLVNAHAKCHGGHDDAGAPSAVPRG